MSSRKFFICWRSSLAIEWWRNKNSSDGVGSREWISRLKRRALSWMLRNCNYGDLLVISTGVDCGKSFMKKVFLGLGPEKVLKFCIRFLDRLSSAARLLKISSSLKYSDVTSVMPSPVPSLRLTLDLLSSSFYWKSTGILSISPWQISLPIFWLHLFSKEILSPCLYAILSMVSPGWALYSSNSWTSYCWRPINEFGSSGTILVLIGWSTDDWV